MLRIYKTMNAAYLFRSLAFRLPRDEVHKFVLVRNSGCRGMKMPSSNWWILCPGRNQGQTLSWMGRRALVGQALGDKRYGGGFALSR